MKMGMVDRSSFFRIQDTYCVDTIKDFWNDKRAEIITKLQSKGPIVALGRTAKGCAILMIWNKDICNHFWYCCKTADTYEEFIDIWMALLHHVTGEHTWALGECQHGPLVERREKEWIESGSVAHDRLTEIILDGRWLKGPQVSCF
ncbi:hypothetical protein UPYG_G00006970 [Umbra pygmaea]|uniref:Uncharacterized protein n=1 Tax=Umbra pygmaea TaxID=75934 RepID=A0ABD0XHY6_UMBPY